MHIESAQGNYTHSWINFFSSIQKGKNSILVKLLHLHIKFYSIAVNSLCTQMLSCFWNWKFWDFMNCHYPFISGEGTSYNNTAMIWIPINTFGPLRKGDVSMVKVTYVTPQVTQLLVTSGFLSFNKYTLLTKCEVRMTGYWSHSFMQFSAQYKVEVYKNRTKEQKAHVA